METTGCDKVWKTLSAHLAHASDQMIRKMASSGGFVKALLAFLLEYDWVDYVICTRTVGLERETIITDNSDDFLVPTTNSIYAPTAPLELLDQTQAGKRYAFVGLPCHCHDLLQRQSQGKHRNISPVLGLFCNHEPLTTFALSLLDEFEIDPSDVVEMTYRGCGWPGKLTIKTLHQEIQTDYRFNFDRKKMQDKCKVCQLLPIYSDFAVGDPWHLKESGENSGLSLVLCNTALAQTLLEDAHRKGMIDVKNCPDDMAELAKEKFKHVKSTRKHL